MKKITSLLISIALLMSLCACATSTEPEPSETPTTTPTPEVTEGMETSDDEINVLVVYFSATGNTENVANIIAEHTGAEIFELEAAEPYSQEDLNYNNEESRVSIEYQNPEERDVELVETSIEGWEDYGVVYIGYPIRWGIAAWPINDFIEDNDFTGKTVVPFTTSASSGLGESASLLADLAGTGNWLEGERFRSSVDESEVVEWLDSLEY